MAFFLFLLVNAALFIRPAEIMSELRDVNIYFALIVVCFLTAIPDITTYLTARPLTRQPITLCVLGIQVAIFFANLTAVDLTSAVDTAIDFSKVVIYFLLLVSLVTTAQRLKIFLACLLVFVTVMAVLPVLQYHELVALPETKKIVELTMDSSTGQMHKSQRMMGSGSFHDPNDLGAMLAAMVPLALYFMTGRKGLRTILWGGMIVLFAYVIYRTQSRGGLLAFLGGLGAVSWMRFGGWRTAALGMLALPALLLMGGRQTDLDIKQGTSQQRVQIWSDWLMEFRQRPVLGNGRIIVEAKDKEERPDLHDRLMAHNAYLQAFADLGFFGGPLFLGAFVLAFSLLWAHGPGRTLIVDPEQRRLQPYLLGMIVAYAVGMFSLSLTYLTPTFTIVAIPAVFARASQCSPPVPEPCFDGRMLGRFAVYGLAFLVGIFIFVRLFVNY